MFRRQNLGGLVELLHRHSGSIRDPVGRVLRKECLELLKSLGARGDELGVLPALFQDDVHQAVDQGYIGPGPVSNVQRSKFRDVDRPGISNDKLHAPLGDCAAQHRAKDRVLFGGIGANDEKGCCALGYVVHRIGHGSRAKAGGQTGHSAAMSKPGTMVDIVCAYHLSGELVHQVVFFVQTLGRCEYSNAIGAVRVTGLAQPARCYVQCNIPVHFD